MSRLLHRLKPLARSPRRPISPKARLFVRALENRIVPATFTVTNIGDTGTGSGTSGDLRYCITQANALGGANTIDATGVTGTINLASVLPTIASGDLLTVAGPGGGELTINANRVGRVITDAATSLTVSGVTLTGGLLAGDNFATGAGGAIAMTASGASLTVNYAILTNNISGSSGGAIAMSRNGSLIVTNSSITGNLAGTVQIAKGEGGGIYLSGATSLTVEESTISFNAAGGAASRGGGIYFDTASNATTGAMTIDNCSIANNTATDGGGIVFLSNAPPAHITSSTITGNVALDTSTGAGTGGGGVAAPSMFPVESMFFLDNTIIAGNSSANGYDDISLLGPTSQVFATYCALGTSAGYTLSSPSGNNLTGANATAAALKLGPLTAATAGSGQSLPVSPLQIGSTAIAGGDPALSGTPDERGISRPHSTAPDIGAFERTAGPDVSVTAANVIAASGSTYSFTVTYSDNVPIDTTTLDGGNVAVSTPVGVGPIAVVFDGANTSNPDSVVATYHFATPAGGWIKADNGTYSINVGATPVSDANGMVAGGTVGSFQTLVPTTYTVTLTTDTASSHGGSGSGTSGDLRYAITQANLDAVRAGGFPADTIVFSNSTAGGAVNFYDGTVHALTPTSALPVIYNPVTITAPGSGELTMKSGIINVAVPFDQTVNINGLTLMGNSVATANGIVLTLGNLSLTDVTVRNYRINSVSGGAILVTGNGTLTLNNCTITGNSTGTNGAGIDMTANGANLYLENSVVSANTCGVSTALTSSTSGSGGGIYANKAVTVTILNSTVANNLSVANTSGVTGAGGGIDLSVPGSSLTIVGSTISNNTATGPGGGGGIYFDGAVGNGGFTIENSTIAGNRAVNGGGIELSNFAGTANITSSTMTANTAINTVVFGGLGGGGIALETISGTGATVALDNSIVSGNAAANGNSDISAIPVTILPATVSAKYSAIGSSKGFTLTDLGHNLPIGVPLLLGPTAGNGGPTQTIALIAGSPAIDAGDPINSATDQRGIARPQGMQADIGAFERVAGTLSAAAVAANVTAANAVGSSPYQFTVTYANDTATILANTIATGNVTVTPPTGAAPTVSVAKVDASNPNEVVVTYQFTPAGGSWVPADDGFYTINLVANQIGDSNGDFVPAGPLTTFQASIPMTILVTDNLDDANPGSLRYAVTQANAATTPAEIAFSSSSANGAVNFYDGSQHVISLLTPLPTIANDLTITGPGSALLVVQGNTQDSPTFGISNAARVTAVSISGLKMTFGATGATGVQAFVEMLTLNDVTIQGGSQGVSGSAFAAINNSILQNNGSGASNGNFIVSGSNISNNFNGLLSGGSILSITDSSVTGNGAPAGGGGIIASGTIFLTNDDISNNNGSVGAGVIISSPSIVTIVNTTIADNTAAAFAGGLQVGSSGSVVRAGSSLLMDGSTVTGNVSQSPNGSSGGGGLYLYGAAGPGGYTISNSTIAGNSAASCGGGVILVKFGGSLNIINSTITGNTASTAHGNSMAYPYGGGGIDLRSPAATGAGTINLDNTIVSGNFLNALGNNGNPDIANITNGGVTLGTITSAYSAVGIGTGSSYIPATTDLPIGANLYLRPLANNGGPTQTFAFAAGSPLLNAGDPALDGTTDQRGMPRPVGPAPDIGAYEYQPITVSNIQINDGSAQRSEVRSITVTFSGPVSFANGNAAAAFQLEHLQDSTDIANLAASVSINAADQSVVTLTFTTNGNAANEIDPVSAENGGMASLADGQFQLTVLGAAVTDAALGWNLDGDADGTPGGDYVSPTDTLGGGPGQLHLYRLFGDTDGNGVVDQLDLAQFRSANNSSAGSPAYLANLDADNSGTIDQFDLAQFRQRNNANVFAPMVPIATPSITTPSPAAGPVSPAIVSQFIPIAPVIALTQIKSRSDSPIGNTAMSDVNLLPDIADSRASAFVVAASNAGRAVVTPSATTNPAGAQSDSDPLVPRRVHDENSVHLISSAPIMNSDLTNLADGLLRTTEVGVALDDIGAGNAIDYIGPNRLIG